MFPFFNFTWDCQKIQLTYFQDQIIPLLQGMQPYKTIDLTSASLGTILLTNHEFIPISPKPCFIDKHVEMYKTAIHIRRFLLSIRNCINHDYPNDVHNQPATILCFQEYARQPRAACFQRRAVKDWNVHCNEVTKSYNVGFVGVREDLVDGAASVILDMLLNFWSSTL